MNNELNLYPESIASLLQGVCKNPHSVLGMHKLEGEKQLIVRVYVPEAVDVVIVHRHNPEETYGLTNVDNTGIFEGILPREEVFPYYVLCKGKEGNIWRYIDAYSFGQVIEQRALQGFLDGTNYECYTLLGANLRVVDGIAGTLFAVWAPHAIGVSVVGDFNGWDGRKNPMRLLEESGVWEIFLPEVLLNAGYQYEITTKEGRLCHKADPYGQYYQLDNPAIAIVHNQEAYKWQDEAWMVARKEKEAHVAPLAIYEVHIGSWRKREDGTPYSYRELAHTLIPYVKEMNYTHIELMGILEHPYGGSWGYQVTGYFAPTSRYGTPDDFKYFVDCCHQENIGVLLDWVPAHFPKDVFGLVKFDGEALYEYDNPLQAEHAEWGTLIFDYAKKPVTLFLIGSALSWLAHYHLDGLRVDAVASMLYANYGRSNDAYVKNKYGGSENLEAVEFIKRLNAVVYNKYPGIYMIAEESTAWKGVTHPVEWGGLGFGFKWNLGFMNDFLSYMKEEPFFRKYYHEKITFSLMYAFNENFIQVFSHDEVVHGKSPMLYKMPGDASSKFANLRITYGYLYMHPGKKLLFMGNEFAQTKEWCEQEELQWELLQYLPHQGIKRWVKDLNTTYLAHKALWEQDDSHIGFEWIDCHNKEQSILSFLRKTKKQEDTLVVLINFMDVSYARYAVGVPLGGTYEEILNSDAETYGGSNQINGIVRAEASGWNGQPYHLTIQVPALSMCVFKINTIEDTISHCNG